MLRIHKDINKEREEINSVGWSSKGFLRYRDKPDGQRWHMKIA